MISAKSASPWIIGMALFSMFFGSGNLIFPMAVGAYAEGHYLYGTLGFLMTAVLLPFAGVFTMVLFRGDYVRFFSVLGRTLGFIVTLLMLTFWIPLGSGPRCVTLAFAASKSYVNTIPLWAFSAGYCLFVFALLYKESRILSLLGKVLTPALLIALVVVVFAGLYNSPGLQAVEHHPFSVFLVALREGYNTQDLIASFFFSSVIIGILNHTDKDIRPASERRHLALTLRGGLVGVSILALVYLALLYLGAAYSSMLNGLGKDALISTLSIHLLGSKMAFLPVCIIGLACITTSAALTLVFANFVKSSLFKNRISQELSLTITSVGTFGMSLFGFESISAMLSNVMAIFYPILIALIVVNLALYGRRIVKQDAAEAAASEIAA